MLAIKGGPKVREHLFASQNTMGIHEEEAVLRVIREGRPSWYRANKGPHFFGGPEIMGLEKEWGKKFNIDADAVIACNSATSGLYIACAAISLKPNDEVIVTPYSMTCSATMPIHFGAVPVFADVEKEYFCIDPVSVESLITEKTKAIIAVDIFGQPCDYGALRTVICSAEHKYNKKIWLITDTAQAPGAMYGREYAGTTGDIGVFSLNFGKHMTCGEGGMIIARNPDIEYRCRLVMNHAESVMNDYGDSVTYAPYRRMIGLNLRMTELQAAVAREQLRKLEWNIHERQKNVAYLNYLLSPIPAIKAAPVRKNCFHTYYVLAYLWDSRNAEGLHRDRFIEAVKAELTARDGRDGEGVQIGCGYIKPIYMMPWNDDGEKICRPVVESLWRDELFLTLLHAPNSTAGDIKDIGNAFNKVWKHREEL